MKESKVLKWLSYIIIPIAFAILIIALFYSANIYSYEDQIDEIYFQSDVFNEDFMFSLKQTISSLIHSETISYEIADSIGNTYRVRNYNNGYLVSDVKSYKYVIVYTPRNKIITNVSRSVGNLEELTDYVINSKGKKVKIEHGNLDTNSEIIQEKWSNYSESFTGSYYYINNNEKDVSIFSPGSGTSVTVSDGNNATYVEYNINDFNIYISYEEEFTDAKNGMVQILKPMVKYENWIYASIPIFGAIIVLCVVYLEIAIGYKKNKEGIDLNDLDKLPLEIVVGSSLILIGILLGVFEELNYSLVERFKLYISIITTIYIIIYILFAVNATTIIKRIKAKVFWRNTIIYKLYKLIEKLCKKTQEGINKFTFKISEVKKLAIFIICYFIIMALIMIIFNAYDNLFLGIVIDIGITVFLLYKLKLRINCFIKIKEQLKKIYEGNHDEKLNEEEFTEEFKEIVRYINDISNGFENAVQEGIKSERLKTELITNVSHDIKTPLTSIINYVDLIKRENIDNEKVKEYIQILESKSHRLKRLTEDLVEASKASSRKCKADIGKIKPSRAYKSNNRGIQRQI